VTAAAGSGTAVVGAPAVNMAIFVFFIAVTLVIVVRVAGNNRTSADYYAGGRAFTGPQNGIGAERGSRP
jgi:cation/acetate symporter